MRVLRFWAGVIRHLKFGPTVLLDYLKNWRKEWSLERTSNQSEASSLSDNDSYTTIVSLASEERWADFRSNVEYKDVLEHVSYTLGSQYLAKLESWRKLQQSCDSELAKHFSKIGNPPVWTFHVGPKKMRLNTTYLRYLHVARSLEEKFGALDELRVCEIGIGFGGQASVLNDIFNPKLITLFDLPPVLNLAKRFHSNTSPSGCFEYLDGRDPSPVKPDLLISNYAFSELQRTVQSAYLEKVVSAAPRGYMMWNLLSERHLGGLTLRDFLREIPTATVEDEEPKSFSGNVLVTWDKSK